MSPQRADHADQPASEIEDHDRGLEFDLQTLSRRGALAFLGTGLLAVAGCSSAAKVTSAGSGTATSSAATTATSPTAAASSASASSASSTGTAAESYTEIPEETSGPYPGDGSNGPNVLTQSGIVRSDIRSSFGTSTTTAKGVPLTVTLTLRDSANGYQAIKGAAVYLWHCNIDGEYSLYGQNVSGENYLRGVQESDADGQVTFTTIFPAAYSGRWPHIHFEVYSSLANATAAGKIVATSQLALPAEACAKVYATSGYSQSVANLARTSLTSDMVFGDDGGIHQLASMSGSVSAGYTAALTVGV
ncbi:intradiol ring-cleavage dioxygenase [Jatrophihabitans sp.]|uniref:intradiol ring-cleavage dioxygenase n=1 Tax=Jatrophihabitans sp. TaxID=1932789 RepID=UPI002B6E426E|nr:intradiol ring-cleavage dioxygenase [Jatrophihabitans sp.]